MFGLAIIGANNWLTTYNIDLFWSRKGGSMGELNRREFMKNLAVGSALLGLGGIVCKLHCYPKTQLS